MRVLIKATDGLASMLATISGVGLVAMMALLVGNIVLRWVASPLHGAYELVSMTAIVVLGLGLAQAQVYKSHVAIDIVMIRFNKTIQLIVGTLVTVLSIVVFVELIGALWGYGLNLKAAGSTTESMHIPLWPSVFVLLIGVIALTLVLVADLGRVVQSIRSHNHEVDIW